MDDVDSESVVPLEILYRDEVCIAINKPAGLLVHRTSIASDVNQFAVQMLRDQIGQKVYPVHRLDRATSGVLIFGLNSDASRVLTTQFEQREAKKSYTALVRGFCSNTGVMDRPLRDMLDARSDARKHERERDAVTEFETVDWFELPFSDGAHETSRYSLLKLKPRTGRRHQIRRHLKHASHPIVGDTTHGDHRHNKRWAERFGLKRMLLAASRLSIRHPSTGAELEIEAALGDEFAKVLAAIQPNRVAR